MNHFYPHFSKLNCLLWLHNLLEHVSFTWDVQMLIIFIVLLKNSKISLFKAKTYLSIFFSKFLLINPWQSLPVTIFVHFCESAEIFLVLILHIKFKTEMSGLGCLRLTIGMLIFKVEFRWINFYARLSLRIKQGIYLNSTVPFY